MCTKKIGENQIILKIEGKEIQKKINLLVIPYDVNFFSSNDILIENNTMPSGNADNPYIIKFKLIDINSKTIDCPDKFNYLFSNSNTTFTDYICNSNQTLYINKSFTKMDKYSFIIPMMNKTYSFNISHGDPIISENFIINWTEIVIVGQKPNITLSLDLKDKYNNSVPKEEIIKNLDITLVDKSDNSYNLISEIKENELIKYTTEGPITNQIISYWKIFYNEKKIEKDYETKISYIPDIHDYIIYCLIGGNEISSEPQNNSEIICSQCNKMVFYLSDGQDNYPYASQYIIKDAYFYNNNNYMKEANFQQEEEECYYIDFNCQEFTNDVFLTFKVSDYKETAVYVMTLKKS